MSFFLTCVKNKNLRTSVESLRDRWWASSETLNLTIKQKSVPTYWVESSSELASILNDATVQWQGRRWMRVAR